MWVVFFFIDLSEITHELLLCSRMFLNCGSLIMLDTQTCLVSANPFLRLCRILPWVVAGSYALSFKVYQTVSFQALPETWFGNQVWKPVPQTDRSFCQELFQPKFSFWKAALCSWYFSKMLLHWYKSADGKGRRGFAGIVLWRHLLLTSIFDIALSLFACSVPVLS